MHQFMDASEVRPAWELMRRGQVSAEPVIRATQERLAACHYAMAHPEDGTLVPACVQHCVLDPAENRALRELLPLPTVRRGAASVAGLLAFGFEPTATRAATLVIQYGAYLLLAVYLMTVAAALTWTWRTRRRPVPLLILGAGVAVLGYVLYRTFSPFPPAPFGWLVLAAGVSAGGGAAALLSPGLRCYLRQSRLLAAVRADAPGAR